MAEGAEPVMGGIGVRAEIAAAEDSSAGAEADAETGAGAAIPRLRSSALSSSISACMAANSFATAGGISLFGAGFESGGLTDVAPEFDVTAESGMTEEASLARAAATWFEAMVCARQYVAANSKQKTAENSRVVFLDDCTFIITVFMLVMEQSFPPDGDNKRGARFAHTSPSPFGQELDHSSKKDIKIA